VGLIDDMKRFLESQIDDFLAKNPHLELQVIEDRLAEQRSDTNQLIVDLKIQEQQTEVQILATAQEIKNWYDRVQKAKGAGRSDLAQAAQARVDALLPQGNQLWGKMQGLKERIDRAKELLQKIDLRIQEVKEKSLQAQAERSRTTTADTSWGSVNSYIPTSDPADPLEARFRSWEAEEELQRLKRNLGK
jgi:uncharacterized protein (TIGR04376 family)